MAASTSEDVANADSGPPGSPSLACLGVEGTQPAAKPCVNPQCPWQHSPVKRSGLLHRELRPKRVVVRDSPGELDLRHLAQELLYKVEAASSGAGQREHRP